jgi:hypothetical protein
MHDIKFVFEKQCFFLKSEFPYHSKKSRNVAKMADEYEFFHHLSLFSLALSISQRLNGGL